MAFWGQIKPRKKELPYWPDWLSYLAASSKSHHQISISCIFFQFWHKISKKKGYQMLVNFFSGIPWYHKPTIGISSWSAPIETAPITSNLFKWCCHQMHILNRHCYSTVKYIGIIIWYYKGYFLPIKYFQEFLKNSEQKSDAFPIRI